MVFTTLRRIIRKGSPFAADRSHIHHLFLDLGFSHRRALVMIVTINLAATSLGLLLHRLNAPEYYQLGIFIGMFALYCLLASQAWIVANKITTHHFDDDTGKYFE
jgi:UDP-GlcNAc:undecaprenyl-phosphate GlcNAc-1-phosphate transferase